MRFLIRCFGENLHTCYWVNFTSHKCFGPPTSKVENEKKVFILDYFHHFASTNLRRTGIVKDARIVCVKLCDISVASVDRSLAALKYMRCFCSRTCSCQRRWSLDNRHGGWNILCDGTISVPFERMPSALRPAFLKCKSAKRSSVNYYVTVEGRRYTATLCAHRKGDQLLSDYRTGERAPEWLRMRRRQRWRLYYGYNLIVILLQCGACVTKRNQLMLRNSEYGVRRFRHRWI